MMNSTTKRYIFYAINIIGGISVLYSYAHGLSTHIELRENLWGDIPLFIRPYYTLNMILAAIGYFFFTNYILKKIVVNNHKHLNLINILYAGIIVPSAIWMPMTFEILKNPTDLLWLGIQIVLFIVGLSTTVLILFFFSKIRQNNWHFYIGILGLIPFWIQTMILDALIWPYYFIF